MGIYMTYKVTPSQIAYVTLWLMHKGSKVESRTTYSLTPYFGETQVIHNVLGETNGVFGCNEIEHLYQVCPH
jgi:hypothetical protein